MAQVIIRNLDDRTVARLKARARMHGRSLESELRDLLRESATTDEDDFISWVRKHRLPPAHGFDAVTAVREGRAARSQVLGEAVRRRH